MTLVVEKIKKIIVILFFVVQLVLLLELLLEKFISCTQLMVRETSSSSISINILKYNHYGNSD